MGTIENVLFDWSGLYFKVRTEGEIVSNDVQDIALSRF